jgi:hypothetical protein
MTAASVRTATVLGGALLLLLAAPAARAADVALLPLEITGGITASREALEAAVAKGIVAGGQSVLTAPETAAALAAAGRQATCATPGCWVEVGRILGARHLVLGSLERRAGLFHARLQLLRTADGLEATRGEGECEDGDCSIAELGRTTARELMRRGLAERLPAGAASTSAIPAGAKAHDSAAGAAALAPAPTSRVLLPAVGVAAGIAALGAGLVLLARDGTCIGEDCVYRRRTAGVAVATIAVGGVAAALGAVLLVRDAASSGATNGAGSATALSFRLGPGAVALVGRF